VLKAVLRLLALAAMLGVIGLRYFVSSGCDPQKLRTE
jgi:hypothetical protein